MRFPKKRYPFRVGTTSYIVQAGLCENLLWLSDRVDDMQLVLFDSPGCSNLPSEAEVENLKNISREKEISVSVHLPVSIELGDPDPAIRRSSAELFKRTVELTAPLDPSFWVFHVTGAPAFASMRTTDFVALETCKVRVYEALSPLMDLFDDSRKLAIENVLPHFYIEPEFVSAFDTAVCIDIGHLLCHGQDVDEHLARWIRRCRSVHLHGVDVNGIDHQSLHCIPRTLLSHILKKLQQLGFGGTLTLEVFEREGFERSIVALEAAYSDDLSSESIQFL